MLGTTAADQAKRADLTIVKLACLNHLRLAGE